MRNRGSSHLFFAVSLDYCTETCGRVGLGLAVTRKLRDANGARISVRSTKAVGSIFSVYVPVVALLYWV